MTRLGTGIVLFVIVTLGCVRLYQLLAAKPPEIQVPIPLIVWGLAGLLIFWLMNKPSIADFLISAEGEIKKVSWTTRKEIFNSTMIVIVVVIVMASGLGAIDTGFGWLFSKVLGLY